MSSFSDDEEHEFFDAHENIASLVDTDSGWRDCHNPITDNCNSESVQYDVWVRSPGSVRERRRKFFRWMGLSLEQTREGRPENLDNDADVSRTDFGRVTEHGEAVSRSTIFDNKFCPSQSSFPSRSTDGVVLSRELDSSNFLSRNEIPYGGNVCSVDVDGRETNLHPRNLYQLLKSEEPDNSSGVSFPAPPQCSHRDDDRRNAGITERVKRRWLSRLRSMICVMNMHTEEDNLQTKDSKPGQGIRVQRIKVRHCRKRLKEFSALFMGQEIQAHEGSILSMKFSLDGRYLATAGEDAIVRVWQVVEDDRLREVDIPYMDPSCIYFTVNHLSELAPLIAEKETISKLKSLKKTPDSACIVFPPKVFRIIETPLHVFQGHSEEVLDISWSENNSLLTASVDKTVRLWQVGIDHCLKVFPHNNYVTSVQFNPVDNNYFISGSIDGKVRVWATNDCQVVDWIDLRDIVTAVSYRPDGLGGIVGTITGICCLFNASGNHMEVESQVCLNSKKKSAGKRIRGFQFFPQDLDKVMVTSADAQVRILSGLKVITKFKGLRNGGNFMSASFTAKGNYIVSASDDSNVYVWNSSSLKESSMSIPKSIRSSEYFSSDALIAIPWCGLNAEVAGNQLHLKPTNTFPFPSSTCLSLVNDFCLESNPRGCATWPEEKLPSSAQRPLSSLMSTSQYRFLRTSCQNLSSSHAWGLVLVTASWDGRIRSFHNYGLPVPD